MEQALAVTRCWSPQTNVVRITALFNLGFRVV